MSRLLIVLFIVFFSTSSIFAQILTGLSAKWNDDFSEWLIFTDYEEVEGELTRTWQLQNDWSSFDYRIEEAVGNIKIKWRDNPNEWEARGDNEVITARTRWTGDFSEWRITNNDISIILKSKWSNNPNVWVIGNEKYGYFEMYMYQRNDFREWIIIDELVEEMPLAMKMMMVFLVMNNSTPKF